MADLLTSLPGMLGDIKGIMDWCKEYYKSVRDSSKNMHEILTLLGSWIPELELLQDLVSAHDASAQSLRMTIANQHVLEQTKDCLRELKELVTPENNTATPCGNSRRRKLANVYDRLTWPILKQDKANELLRELETHKASISLVLNTKTAWNVSQLREEVHQVGAQMSQRDKRTILSWLQPDKIDSHEIHLEKQALLEDETCDWMTRSDIWQVWMEGGSTSEHGYRRFLWIHGIPGSGKTILASYLIDTVALSCQAKGYSYYYCSHQRGQDETRSFLQWALRDFCIQSEHFIPLELSRVYEQHQGSILSISVDSLLKCLLDITKQFRRQVYIIVDAVDESAKPRGGFLKVLTTIGADPSFRHVSLLMISRDELEIRAAVQGLPLLGNNRPFLEGGLNLTPQISPSRPTLAPHTPRTPQATPTRRMLFRQQNSPLGSNQNIGASDQRLNSHASEGPYDNSFRSTQVSPGMGDPQTAASQQNPRCSITRESPFHSRSPSLSCSQGFEASDQTWSPFGSGDPSYLLAQVSPDRCSTPSSASQQTKRPSLVRKYSSMDLDDDQPQTSTRTSRQGKVFATPTRSPRHEVLMAETSKPNQAYTELSMDNQFVLRAIRTYVHRRLQQIDQLRFLRPEFLEEFETKLARGARGMFRWAACQIDMIDQLELSDEKSIQDLLTNLPPTVFDIYEKLILSHIPRANGNNQNNRTFARTALALICSNSSRIPSADVLVQASLFNVPRGLSHNYDIQQLERILGCLIKVTRLNRKPPSVFKRDNDDAAAGARFRVTPAHYTVKEYLFDKETAKGPAQDFALSNSSTQVLELEVAFNGLLQFGSHRPRGQRDPTPYEEYCLKMTDVALRTRRTLIAKVEAIWEAVLRCLRPHSPHLDALRSREIRQEFPRWAKLATLFRLDKGAVLPARPETSTLVSLLVLKWPELAALFLQSLAPEDRAAIWTDRFTMTCAEAGGGGRGRGGGPPLAPSQTILQLCVSWRRLEFLEHLINAGADFAHETTILYAALRDPYAPPDCGGVGSRVVDSSQKNDDGSTTGQLLKMLLERGADPNPAGYRYTPLQAAVRQLEERWVQSLLLEHADANAVGDPDGAHPYYGEDDDNNNNNDATRWFNHHPLQICREAKPVGWADEDTDPLELADQIANARVRVEALLFRFGARNDLDEEASDGTVERADASRPDVIVIDS